MYLEYSILKSYGILKSTGISIVYNIFFNSNQCNHLVWIIPLNELKFDCVWYVKILILYKMATDHSPRGIMKFLKQFVEDIQMIYCVRACDILTYNNNTTPTERTKKPLFPVALILAFSQAECEIIIFRKRRRTGNPRKLLIKEQSKHMPI